MIQFSQAIQAYVDAMRFQKGHHNTFERLINENRDQMAAGPDGFSFLPIEWLQTESDQYFKGEEIAKIFFSSGTQSKSPSKSLYSPDGSLAYKLSCLTSFNRFCQRENINFERIVSLVPNLEEWPHSSLSQMLEWMGEFIPTTFTSASHCFELIRSSKVPTLYVGTAFHWIHLLDENLETEFPKHSFLLETGGTKGRSRHLNRQDFYTLLKERFHLKADQILSEYGMSELSSQAWARGDHHSPYRFEEWVKIHIAKGQSQLETSGVGSLVVYDPTRLDYPYSFRIQDVINLNHQDFTILGRVPFAVAKGCSLMAEQPKLETKEKFSVESLHTTIRQDFLDLKRVFQNLCQNHEFLSSLAVEFYSLELAERAIRDAELSFPTSREDLEKAAARSSLKFEHVLIIPPSTHSFAILHPLILAIGLGAKVRVRIPESFSHEKSSLRIILKTFKDAFASQLAICPSNEVLVGSSQELLVFFGSDESLLEIRKNYLGKIAAFTSSVAISIIDNLEHLQLALLDALSMAGKGCMSARAIYVKDRELADILKEAQKVLPLLPKLSLSAFESCALDHYETRLIKDSIPYLKRSSQNDILISMPSELDYPYPTQLLSIPIYSLDSSQLSNFLEGLGSAVFISSDLKAIHLNPRISLRFLGKLNLAPYDGLHQNRPIFLAVY